MTRFYLDTEFIEDGHTIDLLSIGVVCEDGREFYAENGDADLSKANDWVQANVLPHLQGGGAAGTRAWIQEQLLLFVGDTQPAFWGYYADYDWVAAAQLFGTMMDLPETWPMYCNDLKQLADTLGNPQLPAQTSTEHHALADARWNRDVHLWLLTLPACTHSRVDLLELLADRRDDRTPTPRIDTMRRRLQATIDLLMTVSEELEDLNVLAYDRRAAADDIKVSGGERDYALDTNGDPRARDAYRQLSMAQADMFDIAAEATHDVLTVLRSGERSAPRGPRLIRALELAEAIGLQAKRAAAGDYTPVRRELQPEADKAANAVAEITRERDTARTKAERQLAILQALAATDPVADGPGTDRFCTLCEAVNPIRPTKHTPACPWRRAVTSVGA